MREICVERSRKVFTTMTSLKIELVNDTHTISIVEVVKKIFLRDVETGITIKIKYIWFHYT